VTENLRRVAIDIHVHPVPQVIMENPGTEQAREFMTEILHH